MRLLALLVWSMMTSDDPTNPFQWPTNFTGDHVTSCVTGPIPPGRLQENTDRSIPVVSVQPF